MKDETSPESEPIVTFSFNDPELDPEINFSFELLDGRGKELSEDYKLYKDDVVELKRNEYYKFMVIGNIFNLK